VQENSGINDVFIMNQRPSNFQPELPDGIFLNRKCHNFEGLAMEDVGIFNGHLVYSTTIWYILWSFGIFFPFWYVVPKSGNPASNSWVFQ
jgi:hypothetical protein